MKPSDLPLPVRDGVGPSCVALPEGPWPTVAAFLIERFSRIDEAAWRNRISAGEVVDARGRVVRHDTPFEAQLKVYYYRSPPVERPFPMQETVLHQDDWIVVADKPHFMPVTPSGRHLHETLLVRLKRRLRIDTLAPVHRIDRDTAGLVLFSVQPQTRGAYQSVFRERSARKVYEAIAPVRAGLEWPMTLRNRLVDGDNFMTMREEPGEPNSETRIELLESKDGLGRYRLQPLSGRRHQLRVHMAGLGLPLLNDGIYPVLMPELEVPDFDKPLQLVARELAFTDPVTGASRAFESAYRVAL
ncbi:pseudouridine synthase [Piscinibacter sp. HJYY11]|uniref:pseudouridine synthase n=1 Tax=Piscinibacter sp. HJYY11 TaxID=2801333 RepID=UPI00191F470E|nr:pseudouridine synthase [Piscinibacter sp. HJYY11]MBL0731047.1 pseudouridine synthase [Piscinibacter sp. HJYY11]